MTLLQTERTSSEKKLTGKIALVTGASRGIGKAIALKLAEEGADVILTYSKGKSGAEATVKEVEALGRKAVALQADAQSAEEQTKLIEQIKKQFGRIDLLVNNAAIWDGGRIDEITIDQYDRLFNVNVRGVVATTIAALPLIADGGRIITISSVAATTALAGYSIYSATKAALNSLTRIWAQELGQRGITVNTVSPGTTQTDMYDQAMNAESKQYAIEKTALGRVGQPQDIANVVAFLASQEGGWITGQDLRADGGINL